VVTEKSRRWAWLETNEETMLSVLNRTLRGIVRQISDQMLCSYTGLWEVQILPCHDESCISNLQKMHKVLIIYMSEREDER
jgi:hypothetical protein